MGILASLTANIHRSKNAQPTKPIDFMPFAEKPKWTPEMMKAAFSHLIKKKED